jgi:hypothetical protein
LWKWKWARVRQMKHARATLRAMVIFVRVGLETGVWSHPGGTFSRTSSSEGVVVAVGVVQVSHRVLPTSVYESARRHMPSVPGEYFGGTCRFFVEVLPPAASMTSSPSSNTGSNTGTSPAPTMMSGVGLEVVDVWERVRVGAGMTLTAAAYV